ncbi:MAG: tetratricopeptide repeat protein [Chloroflexota bacterium]
MDPITSAISAAAAAGLFDTGQPELIEAYQTLKNSLHEKFGAQSELATALAALEKKPDSPGRRNVLHEEILAVKADRDAELLTAAQILQQRLNQFYRASARPLQRPPRAEPFIGRSVELAQLLDRLQPGRVIAVCGPGGIGKSALAAEAVWQLAPADTPPQAFPDGIVYYNFRNRPRTDIALEHIARIFNETPTPTPYDAAERALANRQALLVIDGGDQADDLAGILAAKGHCAILLSSRQSGPVEAEELDLGPLSGDEAAQLLQVWGGWQVKPGHAAARICELLGYVPLALKLAGHYMLKQSVSAAQFLNWLEQSPLAELEPAQRPAQSVSVLLQRSLAQVSETAQQALVVTGLLGLAPFDQAAIVEALTEAPAAGLLSTMRKMIFSRQKAYEPPPNIGAAMRELVDYGLLEGVERRYQIGHSLIHAYAQQHLSIPEQATKRLASFFVKQIWEQTGLGPDGYIRLEADRPHMITLLTQCLEVKDWEAVYSLATAVEDYLDRRGFWMERVIANEAGLIAAWQLQRPSEGAWLGNLGDAYRSMGHTGWAIKHFEQALTIARQTGHKQSEANSLGNLGLAYRDLGQIERARSYLQQSLAIFERINSPSAGLVRDWLAELEAEE